MSDSIADLIAAERLPESYRRVVAQFWQPLAEELERRLATRHPLIVGINGAQGSGKSTLCRFLEVLLGARGWRAVTLALDDLYLRHDERARLAREVHPLFATRGVPGTHAIGLGVAIVEAVLNGEPFTLPRFDKSTDDRARHGTRIEGPVDVLLIEGWCIGARPQPPAALHSPVNALEADEDADGIWRGVVNMHLAAGYAQFFGFIDVLVMLKVESFEAVFANRQRQERKLAEAHPNAPGLMDDAQLARFIQHYERLTRHMLAELPARADIVFVIGPDQVPLALPDGLGQDRAIGHKG